MCVCFYLCQYPWLWTNPLPCYSVDKIVFYSKYLTIVLSNWFMVWSLAPSVQLLCAKKILSCELPSSLLLPRPPLSFPLKLLLMVRLKLCILFCAAAYNCAVRVFDRQSHKGIESPSKLCVNKRRLLFLAIRSSAVSLPPANNGRFLRTHPGFTLRCLSHNGVTVKGQWRLPALLTFT